MRSMILSLALVVSMAVPSEAAIVYLKDGSSVSGALKIEEGHLLVTPAGGEARPIPYAAVQGVSLDDEPLFPPPRPMATEWTAWAGVAANIVAIATALWVATWALGQPQAQGR